MKIFDIDEFKKNLEPLTPVFNTGVNIYGVCIAKNPKENHLCFLNGMGPLIELNRWLEKNDVNILKKIIFIVSKEFHEKKTNELSFLPAENTLLTQHLDLMMCSISKWFYEKKYDESQYLIDGRQTGSAKICPTARISQAVFIGDNVEIGSNVHIMPGSVVMGDCSIKESTIIYPNVVIYPHVRIGRNCKVHAGSVIGSDGFGYNFLNGEHRKIWHIGGVVIGDNVELGSNCTIDRGTFDNTVIESETKLDNLVHIAHNCYLNKGVIVCAQSGLAGSVTVGKFSAMSGHVAVAPGVEIGNQCEVVGHSAVFENIKDKMRIAGYPAKPMKEWLRSIAALRRLTKKG